MTKLDEAVELLLAERQRIDAALASLGVANNGAAKPAAKAPAKAEAPKRIMSAEARKKIADAQKKRWAKAKKEEKATK